jgi:hypothetical protein
MKETTIDVQTGEKSTRDLTPDEVDQIKQTSEIEKAVNAESIAKLAAKNALFVKLGITQDEAKLLLG